MNEPLTVAEICDLLTSTFVKPLPPGLSRIRRGRLATSPRVEFSREDHEQLAQLIGYSVSGAGDLSYMSDRVMGDAFAESDDIAKRKRKPRAKGKR